MESSREYTEAVVSLNEVAIYLAQLDLLSAQVIYKQLVKYLICLSAPDSESYLPEIQAQLESPYSWLAKAELIDRLPAMQDDVEKALAVGSLGEGEKSYFEDAKRRIAHYLSSIDNKLLESVSQIYNGMHILFNDKLPLDEVRNEVGGFLGELNVSFDSSPEPGRYVKLLDKLKNSSLVSSLKAFSKFNKRISIQSDLFLKKFSTAAEQANRRATNETESITFHQINNADTLQELEQLQAQVSLMNQASSVSGGASKQLTQFQCNRVVAGQMMTDLKATVDVAKQELPEAVFARVSKRTGTMSLAKVIQNYSEAAKKNVDVTVSPQVVNDSQELLARIEQRKSEIKVEQRKATEQRLRLQQEALKDTITEAESLVKIVSDKIATHKLQLTCAANIKACYKRFSLLYLFRLVFREISDYKAKLTTILSRLEQQIDGSNGELASLQASIRKEVIKCLDLADQYCATLDVNSEPHNLPREIHPWQDNLNQMILSATESQLQSYTKHLHSISLMRNDYLQAVLVIRFAKITPKLSQRIIDNMASWSSRVVDINVVSNTFGYLGLRLSDKSLSKICPGSLLYQDKSANTYKELWQCCLNWLKDQYIHVYEWFQTIRIFQ